MARVYACMLWLRAGYARRAVDRGDEAFETFDGVEGDYDPIFWAQLVYTHAAAVAHNNPALSTGFFERGEREIKEAVEALAEHEDTKRDVERQLAHHLATWGGILNQQHAATEADPQHEALHAEGRLTPKNVSTTLRVLHEAREIYRRQRELGYAPNGEAEALTNLGVALTREGATGAQRFNASLAFDEAIEIAKTIRNPKIAADLAGRARIAKIQRLEHPGNAAYEAIKGEAEHAEAIGLGGIASVRFAIAAEVALQADLDDEALQAITEARRTRPESGGWNDHKFEYTEARIRATRGDGPHQLLPLLFRAASMVATRLNEEDIPGRALTAVDTHDIFRLLSRVLLDDHRPAEALAAFEYGRNVEHRLRATASDQEVVADPFLLDDTVDLTQLHEALAGFVGVALVIAILPPGLVAFVAHPHGEVEAYEVKLGDQQDLKRHLLGVPVRLHRDHGVRAIPDPVLTLAARVVEALGGRTIQVIAPYSELHLVPWPVVLAEQGGAWDQVAAPTTLSLLTSAGTSRTIVLDSVQALGYGEDEAFLDEARLFARPFGAEGSSGLATPESVRRAFEGATSVYLSCHGAVKATAGAHAKTLVVDLQSHTPDETTKVPLLNLVPETTSHPMVFLSSCQSGVYDMGDGDIPHGAAPEMIRRGTRAVLATRFQIRVGFAEQLAGVLAPLLASGMPVYQALARAHGSLAMQDTVDTWKDLGCLVMLCGD